jgi:hypothetical protein
VAAPILALFLMSSDQSAPEDTTADVTAPTEEASTEEASTEETPVAEAPANETPAEENKRKFREALAAKQRRHGEDHIDTDPQRPQTHGPVDAKRTFRRKTG